MRRHWKYYVLVGLMLAAIAGCGRQHPVKVFIDPAMERGEYEKIAVFHFASSLHHADDPDNVAPRMMDELFLAQLDTRGDYKFVAPASVEYALDGAGLKEEAELFVEAWKRDQVVDGDFLLRAGEILQVDGILIGTVDLWQKDEVDYRENAAAATYVGATVTVFSVKDGSIAFQASDENFLESARSEERTVQTSALGAVRSDQGANVYDAPPHKEVAIKVVRALVASIPRR